MKMNKKKSPKKDFLQVPKQGSGKHPRIRVDEEMGKHQEPRRRYRDEEESQEEYVDDNQQEVQESEQESSEEPRPKRPKHSLLPSESEYESTDGNPENDCDW